MESNQSLGNSLSNGVHLRHVTTTSDSNSDVDIGKLVKSNNQKRLVDFEPKDFGLDKRKRRPIDLDETFAGLYMGNCSGSLFLSKRLVSKTVREAQRAEVD